MCDLNDTSCCGVCASCHSEGVWRLCVWQILSSVRQWHHVFVSESHSEVPLWFLYFCVGCRRGRVSSQIYLYIYLYTWFLFGRRRFGARSDAVMKCGSVFVSDLHTDSPPSVLPVFSFFFFTWSVSSCVLCVAPKCSEILLGTLMLNSQEFSTSECFGRSFSNASSPWGCQCFSLSFECISYHPSICMHVENSPRCRTGSTLSLFLSLINFNSFYLLFSD